VKRLSTGLSTGIATTLAATLSAALVLTACGTDSTRPGKEGDPRALTVSSTDDECDVSAAEAPAGTLTFAVTNDGEQVTEFYLLADDGLRIIGEVEGIGPQTSKTLTVNAPAGSYVTACKPGMVGKRIRADFAVAQSDGAPEVSESDQELIDQAQANYAAYVEDQSAQLVERTAEFVELYRAGEDDAARALYPVARTHWERIETVAESFGDRDPKTDAREADVDFAAGEEWTGWHVIEKDLWPADAEASYEPLTPKQRTFYADDLLANTTELNNRIEAGLQYPIDAIANGARGLLEEVALGKITGEEEIWSHTDLWAFQANVDGAKVAFEGVKALVEENDPELAAQLTDRFADLQTLLDTFREGDGFVDYDELSEDDVRRLAAAVDALSEPLSRLTAAVVV
jgi:iron uptake system component EfeO